MKTLEELRARLVEIHAELEGITDIEKEESVTLINNLNDEFGTINGKIETLEKLEAMKAAGSSAGRQTKPPGVKPNASASQSRQANNGFYGFENMGGFFGAVQKAGMHVDYDERLKASAHQEKVGTDGGFLVPDDLRSEITKKFEGDESLLSRTKSFNVSGNRLVMPLNEQAPWSGEGSNITAYWENERALHTRSKGNFSKLSIDLDKLTAYVVVTDEMLEDSALIESFIRQEAPEVMNAKINNAIISGSGVGQPEGFLNSGFGYEVAKEGGQAADTVVFENLKKLYTHGLPGAKRNGVYLFNVGVEEQLIGMKLDSASTDSGSVYLPNQSIAGAPFGTLWGRPVFPMMGAMPQLGDKGDIALADFGTYYSAVKTSGVKQLVSTHIHFDTDEVAFKFSFRMGGKCPFKTPAETEFGAYKLSGFTYLAERA